MGVSASVQRPQRISVRLKSEEILSWSSLSGCHDGFQPADLRHLGAGTPSTSASRCAMSIMRISGRYAG